MKSKFSSLFIKSLLSTALILPLLPQVEPSTASAATATQHQITLLLDGQPLNVKLQPAMVGDTLYVPLREVLEACGVQVNWTPDGIEIVQGDQKGVFDPVLPLEGYGVRSSIQQNGRWMIHVRLLEYLVGADVRWDATERTVHISMQPAALFEAIAHSNVAKVSALLEQGVDPNSSRYMVDAGGFGGQTALQDAMEYGNPDVIKALLEAGADPDYIFAYATKGGRTDLIRMLLDYGFDPNPYAPFSEDHLLFEMIRENYTASVQAFLFGDEQRISLQPEILQLALKEAIPYENLEMIRLLLEAGADPNAPLTGLRGEQEPPEAPTDLPLHSAAMLANPNIVKLLLEHGANPNLIDKFGYTPLHISAEWGDKESTQALLDAKADPNQLTKNGANAWVLATLKGNNETAQLLRSSTKRLEIPSTIKKSMSPFYQALSQTVYTDDYLIQDAALGDTAKVKQWLADGHDPNVSHDEQNALLMAVAHGFNETVQALLDSSTPIDAELKKSALYESIVHNNLTIAELLLKNGADQQAPEYYRSPLDIATDMNNAEMIRLLLKYGRSGEIYLQEDPYFPLLETASLQGNAAALQALLHADVDYTDPDNRLRILKALSAAIEKGHYDCIALLLAKHPDESVLLPALQTAVRRANQQAIRMLLDAGADPLQPYDDISAVDLAKSYDNQEILKLLQPTTP